MKVITVDVRDDIRSGREPFGKIMSAVVRLNPGEQLLVLAPFEPVPLFHVMAKQGFQHRAQRIQGGDWEVLFSRISGNSPSSAPGPLNAVAAGGRGFTELGQRGLEFESHGRDTRATKAAVTELDARGLEPPQPMVKILETLAGLPEGATLHARTDRRPMHLYAQLEERGFTGTTEEENDGSFITHIRRR